MNNEQWTNLFKMSDAEYIAHLKKQAEGIIDILSKHLDKMINAGRKGESEEIVLSIPLEDLAFVIRCMRDFWEDPEEEPEDY